MLGLDNPIHIAFLLVIVLLVFGAKRLPEMGRSLGSGMRGFRDELSGGSHELTTPSLPAAMMDTTGANSTAGPDEAPRAEPVSRA